MNHLKLSGQGCGRATSYPTSNKIVTIDGKTHVTWLDSAASGEFVVRGRTLDHAAGSWSPVQTIGAAFDNHGSPSLSCDHEGYLHLVYGPHHHPIRYRRSLRPNDLSEWSEEETVADRCTYPTLLIGHDDSLYVTARVSSPDGSEGIWSVSLLIKPPGQPWYPPIEILRAERKGYSHFQESLCWGADFRRLHLSFRMSEGLERRDSHTVGYMFSDDFGLTWNTATGEKIELPATAETASMVAHDIRPAPDRARLECGNIAVDSMGNPHLVYADNSYDEPGLWLMSLTANGRWSRTALHPFLPPPADEDAPRYATGGFIINAEGQAFVAVERADLPPPIFNEEGVHPPTRVYVLHSKDLKEWGRYDVAVGSGSLPAWQSNLERSTGHNRVHGKPGLIYTVGPRGSTNRATLNNSVIWARLG